MHIMEGFLPSPWWQIWTIISLPIVAYGVYKVAKLTKKMPEIKPLLALVGAFVFVISALKLPSVTGSSSHPTGTGFSAILFGPPITSAITVIVLVFQALLLAHGGLTTLGANIFSMGIVGPVLGFVIWKLFRKTQLNPSIGVFVAVAIADLMTYVTTAFQLGLAFPTNGSVLVSFGTFFLIYAITQIPLAIAEGLLAVLLFNFLSKYKCSVLQRLGVLRIPTSSIEQEVKR
jgi:cobalt/nickel transport system permease protein